MPTENGEMEKGKLFIQTEDGGIKELGKVESIEFAEENGLQSKIEDFSPIAFDTKF